MPLAGPIPGVPVEGSTSWGGWGRKEHKAQQMAHFTKQKPREEEGAKAPLPPQGHAFKDENPQAGPEGNLQAGPDSSP